MFSRISFLFALALALALARPVAAQQTVDVGSISGRVVDEMGMFIPGVTITATHRLTNVTASTVSDESGRFRLPYLRIGVYQLKASLAGFKDFTRAIGVSAGSAFDIPIVLAIANLTETIVLVHEAPVIESARSQIAATVSEAEVAALPMNGRNFLDLAAAGAGRRAGQHRQHAAVPGNLGGAGHHRCRSAASATFRTTSSSTACPPMTMRPG